MSQPETPTGKRLEADALDERAASFRAEARKLREEADKQEGKDKLKLHVRKGDQQHVFTYTDPTEHERDRRDFLLAGFEVETS